MPYYFQAWVSWGAVSGGVWGAGAEVVEDRQRVGTVGEVDDCIGEEVHGGADGDVAQAANDASSAGETDSGADQAGPAHEDAEEVFIGHWNSPIGEVGLCRE